MGACVVLMFATLAPNPTPENPGPDAILILGWANRFLVAAYCTCAIVAAANANTKQK